ncbi:hypothetical protein BDF21DRAFT_413892, partial [Thamnidium elegans]
MPTETMLEYIASEKMRTCFFLLQTCFFIFVLKEKRFFALVLKTIKMVCFKFEECSSRIEELEKVLIETEMFLQTFTNEYQKMHTAILNSPHRVYTLETDVELARGDIKITDNYISDLSKEHSKLKAETSSLYKDIDSLKVDGRKECRGED